MIRIHTKENNEESQGILDFNKKRLTKQCELILSLLEAGHKLTVYDAMVNHGIAALPRRIADLKENGYEIKSELVDKRYKRYYL